MLHIKTALMDGEERRIWLIVGAMGYAVFCGVQLALESQSNWPLGWEERVAIRACLLAVGLTFACGSRLAYLRCQRSDCTWRRVLLMLLVLVLLTSSVSLVGMYVMFLQS
ncbi:MAG: hypothetical protein U0Q12_19225 [Vicinamibacterales bacterium]